MLRFRPHHFACTVGFQGQGYSPEFVRSYLEIAAQLRERGSAGDETMIEVAPATDSICEPCPNRRGELCTTEPKIRALDEGHARVLGLKTGDRLSWGEAKRRLADRMTPAAFDEVCAPCGWKAAGICASALGELRAKGGR
jgi:hypothetical protein